MTRFQIALHVVVSVVLLGSLGLLALRETGRPIVPGRDPTPGPAPVEKNWTPDDLWPIFDAASSLRPAMPVNETDVVSDKEEGDYRYITEKHNVVENRESVLFLGMNDDVLFPGAIIEGTGIYDFVYRPIIAARTPITLSLSLEGVTTTGKSITTTVGDPSRLSNVRQGINDLLKSSVGPDTKVPARFDYTSEQVYSREERNLALGVSGSYAAVSVDADFNWKSEREKNKILSTYRQVYYTVDVDLPSAPYDFFDPDAGVEGVAEAFPAGSMPVFVSSVSYGWMAVLLIETDFSKEQMDTALAVAYGGGNMEANLDFGYSTQDVLQSSKIQIIVYGGSTAGITSSTLSGYNGLMELIDGSKEFGSNSPGVPLSYRLRHLSSNLIARMALTEEYTITRAVRLREFVRISVDRFGCTYDNDASGPLDMDRFFYTVKVYVGAKQILEHKILNWYTGGEHDMKTGESWSPPSNASTVVMLDLSKLDPGSYRVVMTAEARDYDTTSPSDWVRGSKTIGGSDLYNPTNQFFTITSPDNMSFDVHYTIEPATAVECETYAACYDLLHPADT